MAKFFVGQRVRVVCPESRRNGQETTVRTLAVDGNHLTHRYVGTEVNLENRTDPRAPFCVFEDHELIPILPEGMQPASWSDCVWKPEHLRSKA